MQELTIMDEKNPISLLGLYSDNLSFQQFYHHQEDIKEVYVGKCTTHNSTRYAVFWKPDCFQDEACQASF